MRILFIHQGFPGQFKHLVPALQQAGNQISVISSTKIDKKALGNLDFNPYKLNRGNANGIHPLCIEIESKVIRGEAVAREALRLKHQGFIPELIIGHPGWGEMLFLGDIWGNVPQIHYVEFFHGVPGTDNDFDGGSAVNQQLDWFNRAQARIKNAHHLSNLNTMTAGITPTRFQHSVLPDWAKKLTSVIHDGIDTTKLCPDSAVKITLPPRPQIPKGLDLKSGDPIITFINRTYEPYRGVHIFLEALAQLQQRDPRVQAILVGRDSPKVSYGKHRNDGVGWLTTLKNEYGKQLDWARIHPLGLISYQNLQKVYQISAAHVYLSFPYVLSWSMLEAMSCGALVIGSETDPVKEIIEHGNTGLLVPFTDARALASAMFTAIKTPAIFSEVRARAREHIKDNYDLKKCLSQQIELINRVTN